MHPDGSEAARKSKEAQELMRSGHTVLLIDAYQTGKAIAPRRQVDPTVRPELRRGGEPQPQYLVFNRSDSSNRVQDILTALAYLGNSGASSITLVGLGDAAVWAAFAAAVAKTPVILKADLNGFRGNDNDFIERFFIPGIQHAGGLKTALALAAQPGAAR